MLNFCDFIQVYVFTTNHHLKHRKESISNVFVVTVIKILSDPGAPRKSNR